ncbi:MAG: hypothetical protein [Bacteriophage sp.]|nr:MAG: hypothetical protein [Bacteriophage sp.]
MKNIILICCLCLAGCDAGNDVFNQPIVNQSGGRECFVISYRFGLNWKSETIYSDISMSDLRRDLGYPNDLRKRKSRCFD